MDPFVDAAKTALLKSNRRDMSTPDLLCHLALEYALCKTTEAPNYGFFALILQQYLTGMDYEKKVVTFCIPQLPLVTEEGDFDLDDLSEDEIREDEEQKLSSPTRHSRYDVSILSLIQ